MSASRARRVALAVVSRVRDRQAYAHETLDAVLKGERDLDRRDAGLATRLAYGTISTRGTLDDAIDRFIDRPGRLEPRVRDALCIAVWEILFGGVEPRVAVNEGVELVRGLRPQAAGLANAALRKVAEAAASFPWGNPETDIEALARLHGHPVWLAQELVAGIGRAAASDVMYANNRPAPLYLAHVPFERTFDEAFASLVARGAEPVEGPLAGSVEVCRPSEIAAIGRPLLDADFLVCDVAAQFAARAVRARPSMKVVEIGAGRGTKTVLLQADAVLHGSPADVWAVDSHAFKSDLVVAAAARFGLSERIHAVTADAVDLSTVSGIPAYDTADAVLVDAPCSGLGTLRRHPDKRWRLTADDVHTLALLGSRLLAEAARLVRPGGFVVYSTCTLTRAENADVISGFLASQAGSGFAMDTLSADVPVAWKESVAEQGWFQSVPAVGGPDGHFIARMRRE